jgi:arsenate reductase
LVDLDADLTHLLDGQRFRVRQLPAHIALAGDHRPRRLDQEPIEWADIVVATCDDACPVIPGKRYVSWELPDPKLMPLEQVRELRSQIEQLVQQLVEELDLEAAVA